MFYRIFRRITGPVPHAYDAFHMSDGIPQLKDDGAAAELAGDGNDTGGHGDAERVRVERGGAPLEWLASADRG